MLFACHDFKNRLTKITESNSYKTEKKVLRGNKLFLRCKFEAIFLPERYLDFFVTEKSNVFKQRK